MGSGDGTGLAPSATIDPERSTATESGNGKRPRRGWRERIEPGLYRSHRVACPASASREPGYDCDCPFQAHMPTGAPGRSYPRNLAATSLEEARTEKRRRQARNGGLPARGEPLTVSEFFWEAFLEKQQLRPATKRNYGRVFRTFHEPIVGDLQLTDLNEEHVVELIGHLERQAEHRREVTGKRNSAWVAQHLIPLQSAMSAAVRWRRVAENPVRHPALPDCPPKRSGEVDCRDDPKAILSKAQLDRLYEAAREQEGSGINEMTTERDFSMFRATYEFALRNSEARGLRWPDIDFDELRINVARQIDPVTSDEAQTKGKRTRRPPGDESVFQCLQIWRHRSVVVGGRDPEGYVWHGDDPDAPMPIGLPNRRIGRAQLRAGLLDEDGRPLIVFHGLRHSRASHLLLDGAPMLEVSRFLGHASQLVTANAYSHLVPDDEFAAIRGLFDGE